MNKQNLILVAAILGILLIVLLVRLNFNKNYLASAVTAIPMDAFMILQTDDIPGLYQDLTFESGIWNTLQGNQFFKSLDKQLQQLDTMVLTNKLAVDVMSKKTSAISAHLSGRDKINIMYALDLDDKSEERKIHKFFENLVKDYSTVESRTYDGVKIYDSTAPKSSGKASFTYAFVKGIFIFSFSNILIENAIRQVNYNHSVIEIADFNKISKVSGKNVKGNLFINFHELSRYMHSVFDPENVFSRNLGQLASWSQLELDNIHKSELLLSGLTLINDSINNYLRVFKRQSPRKIEVAQVLPRNTGYFLAMGISDVYALKNDYETYLKVKGKFDMHKHQLGRIEKELEISMEQDFYGLLEDELVLAAPEKSENIDSDNYYILMKTRSRSTSHDAMSKMLQKHASNKQKAMADFRSVYKIDENTQYLISQFPVPNIFELSFGSMFSSFYASWYTQVDDYLVFSNSSKNLELLINAVHQKRTLAEASDYRNFSQSLASRSNILFYSKFQPGAAHLSQFVNNQLARKMRGDKKVWEQFQAIAVQMDADEEFFFTNIFLKLQDSKSLKPNVVWTSKLNEQLISKPAFVTNHYSGQREILIQDVSGKLYLYDKNGKVLFSRQLPEQVTSPFYQIDFYKNGKLQYLCGSENYLYLIDRLGNYVEDYPIELPASATNPMALFDYDRDLDYRILLATQDKRVLLYDKTGKKLDGWKFDKTQGAVVRAAQLFQHEGKDYVVFADDLKTYIVDRRGDIRVTPKADFPLSARNEFFFEIENEKNMPRMLTTSINGTIMFIYMDGTVTKLEVADYSPDHYFNYWDITGDGAGEFVYVDKNRLDVYARNIERLYSVKTGKIIQNPPIYFNFGADRKKIGITDALENRIYLIEGKNGKLSLGFPLNGNTLFSIGKLGAGGQKFNLVVGNEDNFLYNYEIK